MGLIKSLTITAMLLLPNMAMTQTLDETTKNEAKQLIKQGLQSDVGYRVIESLTTEVGQRLAGSEAEARARDWGVVKLKALGFKNVRVEPFQVMYWKRNAESAEILMPYPQKLVITALGGSIATAADGVTGTIVKFPTLQALKDAPMNGLEGKIVFVDEYMTRTQDGSGYGAAVQKRSGAANEAGKRGAVAALIRSVGTDHHRFPHTGQMSYQEGVTKVPVAALSPPDADQLKRALLRGEVTVKLVLDVESLGYHESGNVIGEIPGISDEIVLIGGHLDSWDLGTGAVDDGAGIGITVGAAKVILDRKKIPKRTIRVVMFGAEEVGLVGAKAYAKKYKNDLEKHIVGAESDFGAGKIWRFETNFGQSKLYKAKEFQTILEPLGIALGANQASGGPDMGPMRMLGMPVVTLKQNGWDYFDLHHTPDDTFDKIKPEDIAQNVAAYAAFVWMAANMDGNFKDD
ncbi:MAG: M20/M25/M40 family metallo-hydrolase [Porticoccaceae bacterium]|nr:M20/M25/M40 family metallo-hydrolase [Porticoccaceae bacterium]